MGIQLRKSNTDDTTVYPVTKVFERDDTNAKVYEEAFLNQVEDVLNGKNLAVCATGSSGEGTSRLLLGNLDETDGLLQKDF